MEVWFSILAQAVLRGLSATDPRQVHQAMDRFTAARNEHPLPFEWTMGATLEKQKLLRGCAPRNDF